MYEIPSLRAEEAGLATGEMEGENQVGEAVEVNTKILTTQRAANLWTAYTGGSKLLFAHAGTEEAAIRRLKKLLPKPEMKITKHDLKAGRRMKKRRDSMY